METRKPYDVIIVGAGIAGLTAAAYLSKYQYRVLLLEQSNQIGGLVNSFAEQGFVFDGGIRSFENSGIIFPMLKQLGIHMDFVKSPAFLRIGEDIVHFKSKENIEDYQNLLIKHFPHEENNIKNIIQEIYKITKYMEVIYGIDNPLFLDSFQDKEYIFKTLIPWLFQYHKNIGKAIKLGEPVNNYLRKFTNDESLIDIITQHFFQNTPTFFALSYFGLYSDYSYPIGGTGVLPHKLKDLILQNQGEIITNNRVIKVNVKERQVFTDQDSYYQYHKLIWACDSKSLYEVVHFSDNHLSNSFAKQKELVISHSGGDSIFSLFIGVDLGKEYFEPKSGAHCFFTPTNKGINRKRVDDSLNQSKEVLIEWLKNYFENTTYEISIPALRDEALAPKGKIGIIVSTLMDYKLVKRISDEGWYDEFKQLCSKMMIDVLNQTVFPQFQEKILFFHSSSPMTIERLTKNSDGAITGWAFTGKRLPSETRMKKIANSIRTPMEHIFQAGQWSYSPSGVPISILTGKLAADKIKKQLKTKRVSQ